MNTAYIESAEFLNTLDLYKKGILLDKEVQEEIFKHGPIPTPAEMFEMGYQTGFRHAKEEK